MLAGITSIVSAQSVSNLIGKVVSTESKEPVSYANVALYNIDGKEIGEGDFCNKYGEFKIENIKPGKYYLGVSHVSYQNLKIKLTVKDEDIYTGTFTIEPKDIALSEINVVGSQMIASEENNESDNENKSEEQN